MFDIMCSTNQHSLTYLLTRLQDNTAIKLPTTSAVALDKKITVQGYLTSYGRKFWHQVYHFWTSNLLCR